LFHDAIYGEGYESVEDCNETVHSLPNNVCIETKTILSEK